LNRLRNAGKIKLAQASIQQRIDLVALRALENQRPLKRCRQEFQNAALYFRRKFPAGEQQAQIILASHGGSGGAGYVDRHVSQESVEARPLQIQGIRYATETLPKLTYSPQLCRVPFFPLDP
jgi:hypothetical protein